MYGCFENTTRRYSERKRKPMLNKQAALDARVKQALQTAVANSASAPDALRERIRQELQTNLQNRTRNSRKEETEFAEKGLVKQDDL